MASKPIKKTNHTIYKFNGKKFDTIKDLASHLKIHSTTASDWARKGKTNSGSLIRREIIPIN